MSSDEDTVKVKKPRSGVRGFARRRKTNEPAKEPAVSGFYTGCVSKCFNQIKAHTLVNEMKHALEDEGDVEDDLLLKCTRKKETLAVRSDDLLLIVSDDDDDDDNENSADILNSGENLNTNAIKSPSPPPPPSPPKGQSRRRSRATKQKKNLMNAVNNFTKSLSDAQRDLTNSQLIQNLEPDVCVIEGDDEVTVRVDLRGNLLRYSVFPESPFSGIISEIAVKEDVAEKCVMLVYHDKTLRPEDTPDSVCLKMGDIINCHITSNLEDSLNDSSCEHEDHNLIELFIQSKSSKHKELIKGHVKKPISSVISEYAERVKKDPGCIQLIFDGEELSSTQTLEMLDIEDGDILDVKEVKECDVSKAKKVRKSGRTSPETIFIE